jgi:hypothetical protein
MPVQYQTRVKLFVADDPNLWIVGAVVCLYDRDLVSRDDYLGSATTNVYGEASFTFRESDYMDLDDRIGGTLPELYVKVFDSNGACVLSTRADARSNEVPDLIRVPVERAVAEKHGLI